MHATDSSVDRIYGHVGGQLLQSDFNIRLQGLHRSVHCLLDLPINLLRAREQKRSVRPQAGQ